MISSGLKTQIQDILVSLLIIGVIASILAIPFFRPELSIYITIIALGASVALQKYIASFAAHFVIRRSSAVDVGDRIMIGHIKGDVRHIGLFHIILDEVGDDDKMGGELTGRLLHIPNLLVLDQPVRNYSKDYSTRDQLITCDYIFDEIRIPLTTDSDVTKAAQILSDLLRVENAAFARQAMETFSEDDLPNFFHDLQSGPKITIHIDEERIWINGRFVTTIKTRNDLKTKISLEFIERIRGDGSIHLK
ncbi:mechanosensitive ion channel domain-containing protein [Methanocella arvoryzae]|uniref:Small-conductance mechanosensitive ion channel n=1 Tax=Methanocella arvoryzae (strain DSM 22066 / NBRC 105507 / MRE50) TaxID=351160 RepID=Q0W5Z4_METAR|nr:mechanosensitive ion channel domain-containing protein [Methanocella arvoryzae]CAJ36199.1 putative small-conductance mechanosensitive ion channel [Methanocella arvoryzae MRE50]